MTPDKRACRGVMAPARIRNLRDYLPDLPIVDVAELLRWVLKWWAVRDSNTRPPACKAGAQEDRETGAHLNESTAYPKQDARTEGPEVPQKPRKTHRFAKPAAHSRHTDFRASTGVNTHAQADNHNTICFAWRRCGAYFRRSVCAALCAECRRGPPSRGRGPGPSFLGGLRLSPLARIFHRWSIEWVE